MGNKKPLQVLATGICKCARCNKEKEEFVPNCCSDCYFAISTEMANSLKEQIKYREEIKPQPKSEIKVHKLA